MGQRGSGGMTTVEVLEFSVALVLAVVVGTLVEYFVHRLMHSGKMLGKKHAMHHQDGFGQGWFGEFVDYFVGSAALLWVGFLYSWWAGVGFAVGGFVYACLAAYSHQLQHDRPDLVFWLPRPVHHLHHHHKMWKHNFGITVDVWDRVFGTYRRAEPEPVPADRSRSLKDYFRIRWF
jgi:sterol desaturase/sphingolipid hydroxylase (fatty acid hydroxylase superfamily)